MNTNLKIAIVAAVPVAVAAYAALSKNATMEHLYEQYPNVDRKAAKKAYSRVMSMALRGKIDMSNYSTEQFDQLFLQQLDLINQK